MTPLAETLALEIRRSGPLSVAGFMTRALLDPRHGYYTTHAALGGGGDFVTAPELSQIFGELIGAVLVQAWLDQGQPAPFCLAELGPGQGRLMADILRLGQRVPGFLEAAQVTLVEASPKLRAAQKARLQDWALRLPFAWVDGPGDLPQMPLFLVANEYLDCLPIRQFTHGAEGWAESCVGVDAHGQLAWARQPVSALMARSLPAQAPEGAVLELGAAANAVVAHLATQIAAQGGAALLIDYGGDGGYGDTLQAIHHGQKSDPLAAPGQSDLTAHVNFKAVAEAASAHCAVSALAEQGAWLKSLGIEARAAQLEARLDAKAQARHRAVIHRLCAPEEMGALFKVIGLTPHGASCLAGLDVAEKGGS